MRDTRDELFRKQYIHLRTLFINLCLKSHNRYCFNILIIIALLYQFHIDYEIYHMTYNKIRNHLTEDIYIEGTISKCCDGDTFVKIKSKWKF